MPSNTPKIFGPSTPSDVTYEKVLATYGDTIDADQLSVFSYSKERVRGYGNHRVIGRLYDKEPIGSDGHIDFQHAGSDLKRALELVSGLETNNPDSLKFIEQALVHAGFGDEYGFVTSPYKMSGANFVILSHDLLKCADHLQEERWLNWADVGALFDIATANAVIQSKSRIWKCNKHWAPYIVDSNTGALHIYTIAEGLKDKERLIQDFFDSDVAVYALRLQDASAAVVVDHSEKKFYFYNSCLFDGYGAKRIVQAWTLVKEYYRMNKHPLLDAIFSQEPLVCTGIPHPKKQESAMMSAEFVRCVIREGFTDMHRSGVHKDGYSKMGKNMVECIRMRWLGWCGKFVGARLRLDQPLFPYAASDHFDAMKPDERKRMFDRAISTHWKSEHWDRRPADAYINIPFPGLWYGEWSLSDKGGLFHGRLPVKCPPPPPATRGHQISKPPKALHLQPMKNVRYLEHLFANGAISDQDITRRQESSRTRAQFLSGYEDPYVTDNTRATAINSFSIPLRHRDGWEGWLRANGGDNFDTRTEQLKEAKRTPVAGQNVSMQGRNQESSTPAGNKETPASGPGKGSSSQKSSGAADQPPVDVTRDRIKEKERRDEASAAEERKLSETLPYREKKMLLLQQEQKIAFLRRKLEGFQSPKKE